VRANREDSRNPANAIRALAVLSSHILERLVVPESDCAVSHGYNFHQVTTVLEKVKISVCGRNFQNLVIGYEHD
jgi:L-asparaginase/Glu-tRNA(Gln) amidotransferase subunit D